MAARPGGPVTTGRREDARAGALPGALLVEHADIPPELTIAQWREQRSRERREQHADRREAARARRRALLVALLTFRRRGRDGPGRAASATSTSRTFDR